MSAPNGRIPPDGLRPVHHPSQFHGPLTPQNSDSNSMALHGSTSVIVLHPSAQNVRVPADRPVIGPLGRDPFEHVIGFLGVKDVFRLCMVSNVMNAEVMYAAVSRRCDIIAASQNERSLFLRSISSCTGGLDTQGFYLFFRSKIACQARRWHLDDPRLLDCPSLPTSQEATDFDEVILKRENESLVMIWGTLGRIIAMESEDPGRLEIPAFRETLPGIIRPWLQDHQDLCHGITVNSLHLLKERLPKLVEVLDGLIAEEDGEIAPARQPDAPAPGIIPEEDVARWRERRDQLIANRRWNGPPFPPELAGNSPELMTNSYHMLEIQSGFSVFRQSVFRQLARLGIVSPDGLLRDPESRVALKQLTNWLRQLRDGVRVEGGRIVGLNLNDFPFDLRAPLLRSLWDNGFLMELRELTLGDAPSVGVLPTDAGDAFAPPATLCTDILPGNLQVCLIPSAEGQDLSWEQFFSFSHLPDATKISFFSALSPRQQISLMHYNAADFQRLYLTLTPGHQTFFCQNLFNARDKVLFYRGLTPQQRVSFHQVICRQQTPAGTAPGMQSVLYGAVLYGTVIELRDPRARVVVEWGKITELHHPALPDYVFERLVQLQLLGHVRVFNGCPVTLTPPPSPALNPSSLPVTQQPPVIAPLALPATPPAAQVHQPAPGPTQAGAQNGQQPPMVRNSNNS